MARILLTGATGYLGSHLLDALLRGKNHQITLLIRQTSNRSRIAHLLDRVDVIYVDTENHQHPFIDRAYDGLIHCATDYGREKNAHNNLTYCNVDWPQSLVDMGIQYGLRWFFNIDTMLDSRVSDYALTKSQFRNYLQKASQQLSIINVRMEHFFGPGDHPSKFISYLIDVFLRNTPQLALTEGVQKRDFIYIDDVIAALLCILQQHSNWQESGFTEYQIGSGASRPIREVVQLVQSACGNTQTQLCFGAVPYRPFEATDIEVLLEPLTLLGWRPHYDLPTALARTIDYERGVRH
jgi:nucleoside-diphosphate-sugar epimerase